MNIPPPRIKVKIYEGRIFACASASFSSLSLNVSPKLRSSLDRARQVIPFEIGGLVLMSLPIVMGWTGMSWVEALVADVALALAYVAYAFVFNIAYDRVFPIAGEA